MRLTRLLASLLMLVPLNLGAQEEPGWELGTRAGLSVLSNGGDLVSFGIPGGAPSPTSSVLGGSSSIHAAFFTGGNLMIEPQLSFGLLDLSNGQSETVTTLGLTGQVAYLFSGALESSPYLGFNTSLFSISNGEDETDLSLGADVGYRMLVSQGATIRFEGAYRRWLDLELDEFNFAVVLGVLLGRE